MTDRITPASATRLTEIDLLVALATPIVPPLWPLDGAIAVNPLSGLEDLPFDVAVERGAELFVALCAMPLDLWRRLVDSGRVALPEAFRVRLSAAQDAPAPARSDAGAALVAKYCAAFFNRSPSARLMPGRELGLYRAVVALLAHDPEFAKLGSSAREVLNSLPDSPAAVIDAAFEALGVDPSARLARLRATIARLPGWAGHVRWRTEHADPDAAAASPATMLDLAALLLVTEQVAPVAPVAIEGGHALSLQIQESVENTYRERLVRDLIAATDQTKSEISSRPDAQIVFCIDVRSEPFRRALEAQGNYETLGYAGFFGLMIAVKPVNATRIRQLPVLVQPQHDIALVSSEATIATERATATGRDLFGQLKSGAATAFATAEATGPFGGLAMLASTFAPRLASRLRKRWQGDRSTCAPDRGGLTLAEQLAYARAIFALTGLSRATSRLVVLTGHKGQTVNNPYGAAYDCGACAGHGGAPNARLLAAILNAPEVRAGLAEDGEALPDDSWFVAAEHDTTVDQVALFDTHLIPMSHAHDLERLRADFARAGETNRRRRARRLKRSSRGLVTGAAHWGEVRPEWGLADNAAFIVAPRSLTSKVDLDGRAFLHSYDWRSDPQGSALATILTAPMVVAQWINCQYLFSTIDNARYGAGDKTVHNAVGRLGVLRGNGGDLCVGLPMQALFDDEGIPAHIPQRLLTIVHAPLDLVDKVVAGQNVLRRLFGNNWVRLLVIDPETGTTTLWTEGNAA